MQKKCFIGYIRSKAENTDLKAVKEIYLRILSNDKSGFAGAAEGGKENHPARKKFICRIPYRQIGVFNRKLTAICNNFFGSSFVVQALRCMNQETKKRILSVEDDADSCDLLQFILSDYELVFADGMNGAIDLFEKEPFNLCLLDNRISDGDGIDLCSKLRVINSEVPIVFASGDGHQKDIEKAMDAGAKAYLVKPYFPEELQKIVKDLIN